LEIEINTPKKSGLKPHMKKENLKITSIQIQESEFITPKKKRTKPKLTSKNNHEYDSLYSSSSFEEEEIESNSYSPPIRKLNPSQKYQSQNVDLPSSSQNISFSTHLLLASSQTQNQISSSLESN
jgi:hypothetical protein